VPDSFKKQQLWSCWTHLGCSAYHLNTPIPFILIAAEEPVAGPSGEPAWMGERLGEVLEDTGDPGTVKVWQH